MRGPFSVHSDCDNCCQQSAVLLSASAGAVPSLHSSTEGECCLSVDSMREDSQIPRRRVQFYLAQNHSWRKLPSPALVPAGEGANSAGLT